LDNLIQTLGSVRSDASNRVTGVRPAHKRLLAYLEWAGNAANALRFQISEAEVAGLILTRRYEALLSGFGIMASPAMEAQRIVNDLVTLEIEERTAALDAAVKALKDERDHWSKAGVLVMPDSSFYIRHGNKLEDVDFASLLSLREEYVYVLIPMVIVDELDGLKQHNKQHVRWRAGYTLAVLDRLFQATSGPATLRQENFAALHTGGIPRGRIDMELLFDPPGHLRLPINDDEIVDRAMAVQRLAERRVTLLTYDTGQSTRGRNAGLKVRKLTEDTGPEPTAGDSRRDRSGA
jgi:hypothetical protein